MKLQYCASVDESVTDLTGSQLNLGPTFSSETSGYHSHEPVSVLCANADGTCVWNQLFRV